MNTELNLSDMNWCKATIDQQAERIKELEAAMPLYDELLIRCAIAEKDLATLRQRIADAPVVAWLYEWDKGNSLWQHKLEGEALFDFVPDPHTIAPLISKEDLQK